MSKSITNPRVCLKKIIKQCANLVWLKKTSPRIEHVRTSCNLCVYLVVKKKLQMIWTIQMYCKFPIDHGQFK